MIEEIWTFKMPEKPKPKRNEKEVTDNKADYMYYVKWKVSLPSSLPHRVQLLITK